MLRPYQQKALDDIRFLFARGKRKVMLHMATGGGKTVVFCEILKSVRDKNKTAIMVVRGRKLVDQASKRLDREGVDHGVLMSGHWRKRPNLPIQICSVDTLFARKLAPPADLIVIDEAHHATSNGYLWLAEQYKGKFFLPVTATPYVRGSLRHIADEIVKPVGIRELIESGFLVPPVYYAPSVPDLTGVRTSSGDFIAADLDKILNKSHPIGDIVANWIRLAHGKPTLCFAVSVRHSQAIVKAFRDNGIAAQHIEASHSDRERAEAIADLESGEIKVLSNVGILCTGVDIPAVENIIMARPTKSYALFVQQAGRGTRPHGDKKHFTLIDHGGNVLRHGCILHERDGSLDPIPRGSKSPDSGLTTCELCFAVFNRNLKHCPGCDAINGNCASESKNRKALNPLDGELDEPDEQHLKIMARRGEYTDIAKRRGYKRGWIYYQMSNEFGSDVADKYCPKRKVPDYIKRKWENNERT